MKYHREEYIAHQLGQGSEREMLVELFGPLIGLEEEWRAQGASEAELSLDAFDFDSVETAWVADTRLLGDREPRVLEETERKLVRLDEFGRRMELDKHTATIALPMTFPVETLDDWQQVRHWLEDQPRRTDLEHIRHAAERREQGAYTLMNMPGAYDTLRQLMGDENACMAYLEEPELVQDVLRTAQKMVLNVLERVTAICPIDHLHVHEDFAGRNGPLVGPKVVSQFFEPYYRACWTRAREAGARIFSIDSDGNVMPVLDALLECGINRVYPNEPAAGMDIVEVRQKYGRRVILAGGIDKHVLRKGHEAIRRELEYKLQPCMRGGGTVFGLDHRIPNGTPLEAYRFYVQTAREILGLPPAQYQPGSWRRMAH